MVLRDGIGTITRAIAVTDLIGVCFCDIVMTRFLVLDNIVEITSDSREFRKRT